MTIAGTGRVRRAVLALAVVLVAVGDAAIWFLTLVACGLSEGQPPGFEDDLCGRSGSPGVVHLALIGAVLVPIAYLIAWRAGREWILLVGTMAAAVAGLVVLTWS